MRRAVVCLMLAATVGGCAGNPFWGWWYDEPQVPMRAVPTNAQLYKECTQVLPLEHCNQLAHQWAYEDQLHRMEMQNAQMMQNQNMMFMYQNLPGRRY